MNRPLRQEASPISIYIRWNLEVLKISVVPSKGYPTSWSWDFDGDGSEDSTAQHPTFTYSEPGSYTVRLETSGPYGTDTRTRTAYITVTSSEVTAELYDDFDDGDGFLDPERWADDSTSNLDAVKVESGGGLLLLGSLYGGTDADSGQTDGTLNNILVGADSSSVVGLKADLSLVNALVSDCAANPDGGAVQLRLMSAFFNNGASAGAGDATGDVLSGFQLVQDEAGGRSVEAFLYRCTDASCSGGTLVNETTLSTVVNFNEVHTLQQVWDPGLDQVVYTANPGTLDEEQVMLSYPDSDAEPAQNDFGHHRLGLRNEVEDCTAEQQGALGWGFVDNVGGFRPALAP